jgi:hypothetical protein
MCFSKMILTQEATPTALSGTSPKSHKEIFLFTEIMVSDLGEAG